MMEEITIKLPDGFKVIIDEINDPIYIEAIKAVAKKKLREKEKRLTELQKQMKRFEKKYQLEYEAFSKQASDSFGGHEDWMDWTYLRETHQKMSHAINKLNLLLCK